MPRLNRASVACLVLFVVACSEPAGILRAPGSVLFSGGHGSSDTPVTSTVADADTVIAPALQIRSDGQGAYHNTSSVSSLIQAIGAWVLDSYSAKSANRSLDLEFSQPIAGSGPGGGNPIAVPSGHYKARAISKCNLLGTSFQALAPGASMPCPLHIKFDFNGSSYAVQMNPGASAGDPDGVAPESNYATITCVSPSSGAGPCVGWTVTPSAALPGGGSGNVAKLLKYVSSHGSTTPVSQGDFYFSFSIGVTNP